ncbi:MAG: SDR family oxidoreductase [Oscillochloris sp.]|nr:SDR family oxidoreductase [Oscillochloris sp.]
MTEHTSKGTLIITGGSRGIGAATAKLAGLQGYAVALSYIEDVVAADAVVAAIAAAGGRAIAVPADVAVEADVVHLFTVAERELGPIGGLVNNAAITGGTSRVEDVSATMLAWLWAVNLTGSIICAREAVKRMSTAHGGAGGAIVNLSSLAAKLGSAGEWVHYAASKGAINTFTIGLAREVAAQGIRVNAVAPGLIRTDIHARNGMPDRVERLASGVPMRRAGSAAEAAEAVVWLLSPAASYVTGTILEVGGGR